MKILYVEDDPVDILAFDRFISCEKMDCECVKADSVAQARKLLSETEFNAVITDYRLGDGTAFDILSSSSRCPVIVITGVGNEEIAIQAMKLGAYDYVVKDMDRLYLKTLPMIVMNAIKRWEAEKLNRLLSHAVMSVTDGICISDISDTILFVNQSFCAMHEYTSEELLGKKSSFVSQDIEEHANVLHMLTSRADINWTGESLNETKSGQSIPVFLSRSLVLDSTGLPLAIVMICRDITELRPPDSVLQELIVQNSATYQDKLRASQRICIGCRSIMDPNGNWLQMEEMLSRLLGSELSYEICPDCRSRIK